METNSLPQVFDTFLEDGIQKSADWIYHNHAARHSAQETHKVFNAIFKANRPDPMLCGLLNRKYGLSDDAINRYILSPPSKDSIAMLQKAAFIMKI